MALQPGCYYWLSVPLLLLSYLLIHRHLQCRRHHETNPSGSWSQATNGMILEVLSWNLKWSLGLGSEKKSQVLRALGVSFCLAVHSGNTYKHVLSNKLESSRLSLWALDWSVWGRSARKSAWSQESKRGDGIPGMLEPHWWESHRQGRPSLPVPISQERPLPWATAVPQYHLSAGSISGWDKTVPESVWSLWT